MKLMSAENQKGTELVNILAEVTDQDGYAIKKGGLVLYEQQVWKVMEINQVGLLSLWNTQRVTSCMPSQVQWLSEDTITVKSKSKKAIIEVVDDEYNRYQIGDFVCRKNGTGRVAKITGKRSSRGGVSIKIEYFYDGCHCTGELYASEVEPADKPKEWDKLLKKWQSSDSSSGYHRDNNGSEYWIGGAGSRSWQEGCIRDVSYERSEPKKKDNIERGDLLKEEVKRLANQERREMITSQDKEKPKIKTRKPGDW